MYVDGDGEIFTLNTITLTHKDPFMFALTCIVGAYS